MNHGFHFKLIALELRHLHGIAELPVLPVELPAVIAVAVVLAVVVFIGIFLLSSSSGRCKNTCILQLGHVSIDEI